VWLAISYAYKGLLQLVAMFMAFHTRKVKIIVLNDSKEIALIVYTNAIILAMLAVAEFALSVYHEVYTALFGLALLLEATVFLALIFIPRVSSLST
jgi:gamma-aminobutyric acid type B receptor